MNNIQIFENQEFGAIRTISDEQGEPLFCGKDVAEALGYRKPENAIATHVANEDKTSTLIQGDGSNVQEQIHLHQLARSLHPNHLMLNERSC